MANTTRLSPSLIQTDASISQAHEACWYGMVDFGIRTPLIDAQKNIVVGSTGMSLFSYGQTLTALLELSGNGATISVRSEAQMPGTIDFGASKRQAARLADSIEKALQANRWSEHPGAIGWNGGPVALETARVAPIAEPVTVAQPTPVVTSGGGPLYGVAGPIKRGTGVLVYGIFGVTCCGLAAPFAMIYGIKALKEYGTTDPGDKTLVIVGLVLGSIGTLVILAYLFLMCSMLFFA